MGFADQGRPDLCLEIGQTHAANNSTGVDSEHYTLKSSYFRSPPPSLISTASHFARTLLSFHHPLHPRSRKQSRHRIQALGTKYAPKRQPQACSNFTSIEPTSRRRGRQSCLQSYYYYSVEAITSYTGRYRAQIERHVPSSANDVEALTQIARIQEQEVDDTEYVYYS